MTERHTTRPNVKNGLEKHLRVGSVVLLIIMLALALSSSALSNSPPEQPSPPSDVRLDAGDDGRQIELIEGQVLILSLEGNPSTGYTWQIGEEPTGILRQMGEIEFEPVSNLLGASGIQTLRFEAVRAGQTTLRLIYHRPWEVDVEPARTFSLQVRAEGPFKRGGSAPAPTPTGTATTSDLETPVLAENQLQESHLPASYNWCDLGGCTPVKNQRSCGSCWAFSTVGPLESNILIHDGVVKDLSEQYLVSCNTDDWDCVDGGWFAHDYHEWKYPPGEPEAGAVHEADFPYVASDALCDPPHTHHETIASWHFVGNEWSVPSVTAIKEAIYEHGPVSAAVCVNSAFQNYSGGIFEGPGCTDINHAIVLVGWDDNQGVDGVWHLRNSWGAYWGESGYMRIGYGVSKVGYAANYVVYTPNCYTLSTKVSPSGSGSIDADPSPDCGLDGYEPTSLTDVELIANARPGWRFTGWSGDASGSDNLITITMNSDKNVTAHFMCDGCVPQAFLPLAMKEY